MSERSAQEELYFEFREDRTSEVLWKLCQEGIEQVHIVHRRILF
jgi:hypothetical protein